MKYFHIYLNTCKINNYSSIQTLHQRHKNLLSKNSSFMSQGPQELWHDL